MSEQENFNRIADAVTELLDGEDLDCVVPLLGVCAAKSLVVLSNGDRDQLSTLLMRFAHMVESEAVEALTKELLLDAIRPDSMTRQ